MKEAIRSFIIKNARKIFEEKSFNHTTVEDICQASQISKPTLYKYFSGKEEILRAVIQNAHQEMDQIIEPILSDKSPFPERLKWLVRTMISHFNLNRGIIKIAFFESGMFFRVLEKGRDRVSMVFFKMMESRGRRFEAFLQEGVDQGYIAGGILIEHISRFFSGLIHEFSVSHILRHNRIREDEIDQLASSFYRLLTEGLCVRNLAGDESDTANNQVLDYSKAEEL